MILSIIPKSLYHSFNLEKFLIISLPFLAVISIFLLDLTLVILMFMFLLRNFIKFEKKFFFNKFLLVFGCFYAYLLFRLIFYKSNYDDNYLFLIFYFRYGFYVIALYYYLEKIEDLQNSFLKSIIFTASILVVDSLIQLYSGKNLIGLEIIDNNRISSFFGDESILGSYLIKILPFLYLYIFKNFVTKKIISIGILIILVCFVIFISGERAAFFLMLIMSIYFLLMINKFIKFKFLIFFISIFAFTATFLLNENINQRYLLTIYDFEKNNDEVKNEILEKSFTNNNFYIISPTHNNYFITSINMFKEKKLIGQGPKTFSKLCSDMKYGINRWSCSTHPHNYYIQLLAEYGLIGFFFPFFIFLFYSFKILRHLIKRDLNNIEITFIAFIFVNLWPLTSSGNFFNNWISILIYIPLSFYLFNTKKNVE